MKKTIIFLGVMLMSTMAFSQYKYSSFNWNIGFPLGDTQDYIGESSLRGFSFETGGFVNDRLALGGYFSWNVFNETRRDETFVNDNVTITGDQFRYINTYPLYFNTTYYFSDIDEKFKAYGGLGIGTIFKNQRTEIGTFAVIDKQWHFGLSPHAGIMYEISDTANLHTGVKYHVGFGTSDSDAISFLALQVGLTWIFF